MKVTMDGNVPLDQYEALRQEMLRLRRLLRWVLRQGQQPWVAARVEAALRGEDLPKVKR
jgi:hypothetical protein